MHGKNLRSWTFNLLGGFLVSFPQRQSCFRLFSLKAGCKDENVPQTKDMNQGTSLKKDDFYVPEQHKEQHLNEVIVTYKSSDIRNSTLCAEILCIQHVSLCKHQVYTECLPTQRWITWSP